MMSILMSIQTPVATAPGTDARCLAAVGVYFFLRFWRVTETVSLRFRCKAPSTTSGLVNLRVMSTLMLKCRQNGAVFMR